MSKMISHLTPFPLQNAKYNRNPSLSIEQKELLSKDIYSFATVEDYNKLTSVEKNILLSYVQYLQNIYFDKNREPSEVVGDINSLIFNNNHWAIYSSISIDWENYLKNILPNSYNNFVSSQHNYNLSVSTKHFNQWAVRVNNQYKNNKNEDGSIMFQPLTPEKFSERYKVLYDNLKSDLEGGAKYVGHGKRMPANNKFHFIQIQ